MAKDWKLDDYGDIDMSQKELQWVEEETEVAQLAETKILKIYDEDAYALDKGVDWFRKMYDFGRDERFKALILKAAVLQIPEVTTIVQLDMHLDTDTEKAEVNMVIDSIYSDEPIKVNA